MKKLENLGSTLTKDDQRRISGGRVVPQSGWTLVGSQCFCDYTYMRPDGGFTSYCSIPCASVCCTGEEYSCFYQV